MWIVGTKKCIDESPLPYAGLSGPKGVRNAATIESMLANFADVCYWLFNYETAICSICADQAAVIQVVEDLFQAMSRQDGEVMRALHMPEVALIRVMDNAKPSVQLSSPGGFINSIVNAPAEPRERMWNPEVRVDGNLAALWAPYDFHLGDDFSHCGVDAFQLVRTDAGWKIVSIAYTVHREGCDHTPPS